MAPVGPIREVVTSRGPAEFTDPTSSFGCPRIRRTLAEMDFRAALPPPLSGVPLQDGTVGLTADVSISRVPH